MELILIITLIVVAIHYSMQNGEIFGKLGNWLYLHLPEKLHQPVFDCPVCMTPWYGSVIYLWLSGPDVMWPVTVIAAMGLNAVLVKLYPDKDADND